MKYTDIDFAMPSSRNGFYPPYLKFVSSSDFGERKKKIEISILNNSPNRKIVSIRQNFLQINKKKKERIDKFESTIINLQIPRRVYFKKNRYENCSVKYAKIVFSFIIHKLLYRYNRLYDYRAIAPLLFFPRFT